MAAWYSLVNLTKRERIDFERLPVRKERELAGNPAGAAIVVWYLLKNSGDVIGFFGDELDAPFPGISYGETSNYPDQTDRILNELIQEGILTDCGILWQDEDNPTAYTRDIRNAWMPADLLVPPTRLAEQAGAGQPATRPVVEPEGGDKPQPEAEGRSR